MFVGSLNDLSSFIRQYRLCSKSTNEALLVIQACRAVPRRPGPRRARRQLCLRRLRQQDRRRLHRSGKLRLRSLLVRRQSLWLLLSSYIISNLRSTCELAGSGCMFHSEGGLRCFEYPTKKTRAMPRVDSERVMCGAGFRVDTFSTMPRVGSASDCNYN
ncbi:hypothetical protein BHM03_00027319 [Ensete ventricosum]|nr:hypothetical protein BHM03_00027319 [Ensete ventricosum]